MFSHFMDGDSRTARWGNLPNITQLKVAELITLEWRLLTQSARNHH